MITLVHRVNRRGILGGGVAASFLGVDSLSAQISNAPKIASSNLKASITLGGVTYSYPNGPTIPAYFVGFRQDGRIVFHLGALGDLTKDADPRKSYNLGPHHVRIEGDGKVLLDADIPAHWWNAQWTYRPAPIGPTKPPAQIFAANRMFPFGNTGLRVGGMPANIPYTVMGSSSVTKYMPTTGERADIGLVTDPSANYLLGGSPELMLAWAQAAGSCPLHFRDEKTGKPIDLTKYPNANSYDAPGQGSPWLDKGPPIPATGKVRLPDGSLDPKAPGYDRGSNGYHVFGGDWTPQQAHFCEMSYIAFQATGDLGFLEDLQYEANFCVGSSNEAHNPNGSRVIAGEYRGIAWGLRQLFMAHVATSDAEAKGILPASCHPAAYFKQLLNQALTFYAPRATDPNNQVFRLLYDGGSMGPWQCDYLLAALGFGVLTGHADWAPLYLFLLGNAIARTNGASGYPPGFGGAYYMPTHPHRDMTKPRYTSWAESFAELSDPTAPDHDALLTPAVMAALQADPLHGGLAVTGAEYLLTTRAVLVEAAYLESKGLVNVRAVYPALDKCIAIVDRMVRANGSINARVSVVYHPNPAP